LGVGAKFGFSTILLRWKSPLIGKLNLIKQDDAESKYITAAWSCASRGFHSRSHSKIRGFNFSTSTKAEIFFFAPAITLYPRSIETDLLLCLGCFNFIATAGGLLNLADVAVYWYCTEVQNMRFLLLKCCWRKENCLLLI